MIQYFPISRKKMISLLIYQKFKKMLFFILIMTQLLVHRIMISFHKYLGHGIYGGDGDDIIGTSSHWYDIGDRTSKLIGGEGSDTFYVSASQYINPVSLDDFNPSEDNIIISPSYSNFNFTGYQLLDNQIVFNYGGSLITLQIHMVCLQAGYICQMD